MKWIFPLLGFLLFGLSLSAKPASAGGDQGILEVRVKDHREAIGDFAKLILTIEEVRISPKPGLRFWQSGWKSLAACAESIDLTRHVGKNSARLCRDGIAAGSFDAIDLKLKQVSGAFNGTKAGGNAQIKNLVGPIKLPFEVRPRGETTIVLDLVVLDMSDHPPQAYELAIRGYELYTDGKLVAKIPPG